LIYVSCEEQPVEIPEFIVEEGNRKVMIEEFTGVSCAPCFDGAAVLEDIINSFPDRVIVNGIHGVFQANPTSESKYDFRYDDAADLETSFFFLGKPSVLIDRVKFDDQDFLTIDINISIEALEELPGTIKIFAIVNESGLNDPQLSNSMGLVLDFTHKHVMKDMLTSIGGDILGTDLSAGEVLTRSFSYTVPNEENGEWIPENMEVVYFVTSEGLNDEVIQADAIHITE